MLRGGTFGYRRLRWGALSLTAVVTMAAFCDNADARRRHKAQAAESYQPSYSSIVVDINSGEVMQATNADAPRHPASLTKIMTLYLLFERLEQGKIKLQTELPVSAHAAVQAPSKLGLKPGETIRVDGGLLAAGSRLNERMDPYGALQRYVGFGYGTTGQARTATRIARDGPA